MIAIPIIRFTFVDVIALIGSFVDRPESSETSTFKSTVQIATVLRTSTVTAFAFIYIGTRFARVVGLVAGEAFTSIFFGVAHLRAAAIIRGTDINLHTCSSIRRKGCTFNTIANHLIIHRIANIRAATILLLTQIDGKLHASLQIGAQIHAVGTFAMIAIGLVNTFVRAFRFRFVAQMLAQITFACPLIGLQMEIRWTLADE